MNRWRGYGSNVVGAFICNFAPLVVMTVAAIIGIVILVYKALH
ncbi:MAG: hypothetical protein UR90_C0007G0025 [Parcubacteria group bacterium GW2011_GWC1_35_8]|nr:MAG: hypothetical protein UR90_C0007G0025 [Parcubacteria group bacterium GW2011_GWC1_35_8]